MKNKLRSTLFSTFFVIIFSVLSCAQNFDWKKQHFVSEAESNSNYLANKDFVPTAPPIAPVRAVAEFEKMQGVIVAYPFGISVALIKEMAEDVIVYTLCASQSAENSVRNQYQAAGVNLNHCVFVRATTDSYWTRDFGPWYVVNGDNNIGINDFPYNRPRPNDDIVPNIMATHFSIPRYGMNVTHTGGNYMTDGMGVAASTTIVLEENPQLTTAEVKQYFLDYLGVSTYHIIEDPNNTYIDHIDCWGKFLDVDKILLRSVPTSHPQYAEIEAVVDYFEQQTSSYGTPYQIYRVYTPQNQPYTNSLILNNKVFVPITSSQWDDEAIATYQQAMPGYEVLGFTGTWESTDALHCRTNGVADLGMLYIRHIPLSGNQPFQNGYSIDAQIIPYSHLGINTDSVFVKYSVRDGEYQSVPMTYVTGNTYHASIPVQDMGSKIEYYIIAADSSGRHQTHPFIGEAAPHTFVVGSQLFAHISTDISEINDSVYFGNSSTNNFSIINSGELALDYTITCQSSNQWLSVNQNSGTIAANSNQLITVNFNSNNLQIENYSGIITINSNDSAGQIITIPVSLKVFGYPNVTTNTSELNLEANSAQMVIKSFIIENTGVADLIYNITKQANWLTVNNMTGIIAPNTNSEIIISCIENNLSWQTLTDTLIISTNDPDSLLFKIPLNFKINKPLIDYTIQIPAGWSGISFNINMINDSTATVFRGNEANLEIIENFTGEYWLSQNINTLPRLDTISGYKIKAKNAFTLTVKGYLTDNKKLQIHTGWNIIPNLANCNISTSSIFNLYLTDVELIKEIGGDKVYWKNQGFKTLSTFEYDKAYMLYANTDFVLTFPQCTTLTESNTVTRSKSSWNIPNKTGNTYTISVEEYIPCKDYAYKIAAFNSNGLCVGIGDLTDSLQTCLTVFGDDKTTSEIDGMVENEAIKFKTMLFNDIDTSISVPDYYWFESPLYDSLFVTDAFSKLGFSYGGSVDNTLNSNTITTYPNPAKNKLNIISNYYSFNNIKFSVFSVLGNEIVNNCLAKLIDNQHVEINIEQLKAGIYFLKLQGKDINKIVKFVVD